MNNLQGNRNWHLLADKFIWYDETSLSLIPENVSSEEIQKYLYTFHGDLMPIEEIQNWRNIQETMKNESVL